MKNCIFCKIVKGELPCHQIWEDDRHLAFLSSHPNTKGFSVLITKQHYPSNMFALPDNILKDFVIACKKVGNLLTSKLDGVGRTGLIFEGFGINHAHAKLFPMHGTEMKEWKPIRSTINTYFTQYQGYISSHNSDEADDEELAELAEQIRD